MTQREKAARRLMMYSFTLDDLMLYLDTHTECQRGLEAFRKYQALYNTAKAEYEKAYGPVQAKNTPADATEWMWSTTSFPWSPESEENK